MLYNHQLNNITWLNTLNYEITHALTDENAVLQSMNYPLRNVGVLQSNGVITSIFPDNQHWRIVPGLCGVAGSVSLESIKSPGYFLRVRQWHQNKIMRVKYDGSKNFKINACFYQRQDKFFPVRFLLIRFRKFVSVFCLPCNIESSYQKISRLNRTHKRIIKFKLI